MYYWVQKFERDDEKSVDSQWLTANMKEVSHHMDQEPVFIHFEAISVDVRLGLLILIYCFVQNYAPLPPIPFELSWCVIIL
ncbi:hypothetical protein GCM10028868_03050 [Virgibacillus kimchii]